MKLVGFISLIDLVLHARYEKIEAILHTNFVYGIVDEDQEIVAKKIEQYDLVALPILNHEGQIVGIVSSDDAIDIIRAEQEEDMEKFMGIASEEDAPSYLKISTIQHLKKRIKWILIVFMLSTFSHVFLHIHDEFFKRLSLFVYLGMITETGGNIGSQTASVVLQALNRGQLGISDWFKIILKESKIALMVAAMLFVLVFLKIFAFKVITGVGAKDYLVTFVVAFSLFLSIIVSASVGAILPLTAKYFNGDPAVAANPAINTVTDLMGMIIYYAIIYWFINPLK